MSPKFPDIFQLFLAGGKASKSPHEILAGLNIFPHTEDECGFTFFAGFQFHLHLDGGARIEAGAGPARKPHPTESGGPGGGAVSPQKLSAIRRIRARQFGAGHKRNASFEIGIVGIAREQRAGLLIDFGNDVHRIFAAQLAQDPFPITSQRELTAAAGIIPDFENRKLDRLVKGNINRQLRMNTAFAVSKDAITESVADLVWRFTARGQGGRRPKMPARFVAQIKRLTAGVGHRIVVPRRQPEFVGIFTPSITPAGFGNDGAKICIGNDIDPGSGRGDTRLQRDDIFPAVPAESHRVH